MKRSAFLAIGFLLTATLASAEVSIETAVSRSQIGVGEQIELDIIISDAQGTISAPKIDSLEGFTSYSRGHSQEITIIGGNRSSRSIFTYTLVANSAGKKMIGPFEVTIGGKPYKIAPVEVDVAGTTGGLAPRGPAAAGGPVAAPPQRALPSSQQLSDSDIFVKVWIDKDEAVVNEPVMLTYTLYTRLSATYKGFDKEPVTTGFWIEDFPPEKTIRRTEQILNGQRYVVADVRKTAMFPTQPGVFTIDPGVISVMAEMRDESFDSFFSYNVFGYRRMNPPQMNQLVSKKITSPPITLTVKALPDEGRPESFSGAVGKYEIESSVDKNSGEVGNPVTWRVRVRGEGNINTLQLPSLPKLDDFKVYDSSSSVNISKERLLVEGEKISETVIVPRKAGPFTIPAVSFSYFDARAGVYRELKTQAHTLSVSPSTDVEPDDVPEPSKGVEPVTKRDLDITKDVRYIHTTDRGTPVSDADLLGNPFFVFTAGFLFAGSLGAGILASRRRSAEADKSGTRIRRSHSVARARLKASAKLLSVDKRDAFYAETSRAVYGYFGDKLNVAPQLVNAELIERRTGGQLAPELSAKIRELFDELNVSRFSNAARTAEEMKKVYDDADRVITGFEKAKLK